MYLVTKKNQQMSKWAGITKAVMYICKNIHGMVVEKSE